MSQGKIVFFTAPSGSGKTTIVKHLLANNPALSFSISATTRPKRGGEIDGKDYYFLSAEDFKQKIEQEAFVEYEEVYEGLFYGTLKAEIERIWAMGKHVIIDIDVKGGLSIKKCYPKASLGVFIQLKDMETLEGRLRSRGTETEEHIRKRLDRAAYEWTFASKFDTVLINDDLPTAQQEAQMLVEEFIA